MAHVSLRVSEQEKNWVESYAKTHGINLSDASQKILIIRMSAYADKTATYS